MKQIFLPIDNTLEASVIPDIDVIGVANLSDMVDILTGETPMPLGIKHDLNTETSKKIYSPDFSDII